MTRLLLSVRSQDEARVALAAGVDLIDVKEPLRGALGAADMDSVREILALCGATADVSVALGELSSNSFRLAASVPEGARYAKFGLAGATELDDWPGMWLTALDALPELCQGVAVAYADWETCDAPEPLEVIESAALAGAPALLLDTFDKTAGGLLDRWTLQGLGEFIAQVQQTRMLSAVAGSLSESDIAKVAELTPDIIGVRGAACVAGRSSTIDPTKVERLRRIVRF